MQVFQESAPSIRSEPNFCVAKHQPPIFDGESSWEPCRKFLKRVDGKSIAGYIRRELEFRLQPTQFSWVGETVGDQNYIRSKFSLIKKATCSGDNDFFLEDTPITL